jgi:hypothetical protein
MHDAFDLGLGVAHGVDTRALARGVGLDPARFAKIEIAMSSRSMRMSTPLTTDLLSDEASSSSGKRKIGR